MRNRCTMSIVRPSRAFFDSSTQSKMTKESRSIRRMRRLTPLRTMRRFWRDASVAASDVGLESGTWGSWTTKRTARAAERGLGRCSYARGGSRAVRGHVSYQNRGGPADRPTSVRTPRRLRRQKNEAERALMIDYSENYPTVSVTTHSAQNPMKGLSAFFGTKPPTGDRSGGREPQKDPRRPADTAGAADDRRTPAARPAATEPTRESMAESPPTE